MTWKDVLKAHCGTERHMEKKLVGNQKKIDADKDGKITGKDFAILREKSGDNFEKFIGRGFKFLDDSVKQYYNELLNKLGKRLGARFKNNVKAMYKLSQQPITRQDLDRAYRGAKPTPVSEVPRQMDYYLERSQFAKSMESKILREIEKEGGALGMKNLKQFGEEAEIKRVLAEMNKEGKVFLHENGDIYTHKPVKGMGSKMPGFKGFPKR